MVQLFSFILALGGFSVAAWGQQSSLAHAAQQTAQQNFKAFQEVQAQLGQVETLGTNDRPSQFYTITEPTSGGKQNSNAFQAPQDLAQKAVQAVVSSASKVSLLSWALHRQAPQQPKQPYNRQQHFGGWINDPYDKECLNTRAKVLIRDSKRPVVFRDNNKCVVAGGSWYDPYTGRTWQSASDIQIDHVVPLKHAFVTGAWKWDFKSRCVYGNFMADNYHLLPVQGRENMSKGDSSPDDYMPPLAQSACGYVQIWLQIKLAWGLVIYPREADAINSYISKYRCNIQNMNLAVSELVRLRKAMRDQLPLCERMAKGRTAGLN